MLFLRSPLLEHKIGTKNPELQATLNKDHFYTNYVNAVHKLAVLQDSLKCQTITMGLVEIQFQGVK